MEKLLVDGLENVPKDILDRFTEQTAKTVSEKLKRNRQEFQLRMSNIGKPCARALWLEKNHPDKKVELRPEAFLKFSFGDLTEEYLIFLAELAGHTVELRQQEVELEGIPGHWDCIIDGMLVDCKSASSYSFIKFKEGLTFDTDSFGYLTQLGSYFHVAKNFPQVTDKKRAAFLVFDKQHGHITLDIHEFETDGLPEFYKERIRVVNGPDKPERFFTPVPDGYKHKEKGFIPNGNELLGTNCSYCPMKFVCYDNIRVFMSSRGPKYFTKIVKEPKMLEITEKDIVDDDET